MKVSEGAILLGVGIGAAVARVVYSFVPWLNACDVLLFAVLGYLVGQRMSGRWWTLAALIVAPAMAFTLFGLGGIGLQRVREGVGRFHVHGLVLFPLAAGLGTFLGRRSAKLAATA